MATIIRVTGEEENFTMDKNTTIEQLREIVGGNIEVVQLHDRKLMLVDEDGKLKGKPINEKATNMYVPMFDMVAGDVIVCTRKEFHV